MGDQIGPEYAAAVLFAIADEIDRLNGFYVIDLIPQDSIQLIAIACIDSAGSNAQHAFFEFSCAGYLSTGKCVLNRRCAVGKTDPAVIPALIRHGVCLVIEKLSVAVRNLINRVALLQRLFTDLRLSHAGISIIELFDRCLETLNIHREPIGAFLVFEGERLSLRVSIYQQGLFTG